MLYSLNKKYPSASRITFLRGKLALSYVLSLYSSPGQLSYDVELLTHGKTIHLDKCEEHRGDDWSELVKILNEGHLKSQLSGNHFLEEPFFPPSKHRHWFK